MINNQSFNYIYIYIYNHILYVLIMLLQIYKSVEMTSMNPDYTSDIRQVQRFIFEHNIYLLNMFQKKIDSFNSSFNSNNKDARRQHKETNLHSGTIIDCDNFLYDPIKNLSRDLTKPIWNCVTKVQPKIVYPKQSATEPIQVINTICKLLHSFFSRLKNQHEDESNMRINLLNFEYDKFSDNLHQPNKQQTQQFSQYIRSSTVQLFNILLSVTNKQLAHLFESKEDDRIQQEHIILSQYLDACKRILQKYLSINDSSMIQGDQSDQIFINQLNTFNKIIVSNLTDIINCKIGSLVLCLQPKLEYLPLFVHPMLISIHSLIKLQLQDMVRREQVKANKKNADKGAMEQKQIKNQIKTEKIDKQVDQQSYVFGEIPKSQYISKMVFINFDGFQSEFNVDIAKYLHKSLMYISFPKESNNKLEGVYNQDMKRMEDFKSERLLRKYFYGDLTVEEKKKLLEHFKPSQKQIKRNLYMFPLHCRFLAQKYNLPTLYNYQTAFISFIMSQIMLSQILQFNPSLIVISYSQKINIHNQYFVELMKQLTVLGNYKVVFYANLSKNYMFQEYYSEQMLGKKCISFLEKQKEYFDKYQCQMKILQQERNASTENMIPQVKINCDFFQKIAIMTKVSSGTYNLNKSSEGDSYIQKFKNYKAMSYSGPLIKKISEQFSNLNKLKMRLNDYSTISKVLGNYFNNRLDIFEKLFGKVLCKYHTNLFKQIEKLLQIQAKKKEETISRLLEVKLMQNQNLSPQQQNRRRLVNSEIQHLKQLIEKKFMYSEKKQSWGSFKFQQYLSISTQKIQPRFFAHIPKYKDSSKRKLGKRQAQNLICLQFYTIIDKQKVPIQLCTSTSKVYYSSTRQEASALIYITNHLTKQSSTQYNNYYGMITEQFDYKVSPKVQLHPISFNGGPVLTTYQNYTQFNYYQTKNYVFMFWPKIFDSRKNILSKYYSINYLPESTSLFFRAFRKRPEYFLLIHNKQDEKLIPRHGCKCYEVPDTNVIYVFGGFYGQEKNYLLFQTDITKITYRQTESAKYDPEIIVQNVPKQFYFDYRQLQTNKNVKVITKLKNDMIRPKLQYEFLEVQETDSDKKSKNIFIIGGIGQNFIRPYSMMGSMVHKVTFNTQSGAMEKIKRINMHNIIPVNTYSPVKLRSSMQTKMLSHAENRSINFLVGQTGANAYTIYHNNIIFNPQSQKFQYETQYQFSDVQSRLYREEIVLLKRANVENTCRIGIYAKTSRGKEYNTNFITISTQKDIKYIIQLQLQLSLDVKHLHPQLPGNVRLTGSSIISVDVNATIIYALIRHPIYTLDQCLLAVYDLNQLSTRFKDNKPIEIQMKQLHKFDEDVSQNILIAANPNTIVVVHGQKFDEDVSVPQLLLRKNRRNHIKIDMVLPNQSFSSGSTTCSYKSSKDCDEEFFQAAKVHVTGGISCSIFLNQNNGNILCFSLKTIEKKGISESVYVVVEKLELSGDKFVWQKIFSKKFQLIINIEEEIEKSTRKQPLKIIQIIESRRQSANPLKCTYQVIAIYKQQCLSGKMMLQESAKNILLSLTGQSESQYFKQLSRNSTKQHSVLLQKHPQMYTELKQGMKQDGQMQEEQQNN